MKKFIIYFFSALSLGLIFWFWGKNSGALMWGDQSDVFVSLGRLTGLLAAYFILWQLLLIGRQPWLEKSFGLDRLAGLHHLNGIFSWLFIILHPVFLSIGYGLVLGQSTWSQFISFLFEWDDMFPAFMATIVFILTIVLSIVTIKKYLKYEVWYFVHLATYLAIAWAFGHQLEVGYDLQDKVFAVYWYLLYVGVIASLVFFRILQPLYNFYRYRFFVSQLVIENNNNISIYISGRGLDKFPVSAGQFFMVRFLNKTAYESHPFSVSSLPGQNYLRFTVKALGDFTTNLEQKIKVGDQVILEGPYGLFTSSQSKNKKVAYIAGGVGITPIRSLVEESVGKKDAILLLANNKCEDIIFSEELDDLVSKSNGLLKIKHVLSQASDFPCELGRIDEEKIVRLIPDYSERDFYICGPAVMRKSIVKTLKHLGVSSRAIHFEKFSW
ncbi:MAG: ferredoxin reductase family protein [Candidatus Falkowbacteria bacterium]